MSQIPDPRRLAEQIERETGWQVAIFTRADIERVLERSLTDAEWERLVQSERWKRLCELTNTDYEHIRNVVESVIVTKS